MICPFSKSTRPKHDLLRYKVIDLLLRSGLRAIPPSTISEAVALWWGVRFRPRPRVVRLRSGPLIAVDPTDYLQLLIYYIGTFEPHCLQYWRSCVAKGCTVLDVGANIGLYSLESALGAGSAGQVLSIEPAPSNLSSLTKNVELNKLTNISVLDVAVSDVNCSATLSLPAGANQGMFSLAPSDRGSSFPVKVRRIDDLLEERAIYSIDLIKMDIEGSEYRALRGAMNTLQRSRPAIFLELNEAALRSCQSSSEDVKELLHTLGYRGWIIGRGGLRPITRDEVHFCDECLFIHSDSKSLLRRLGLQH